MKKLLIICLLAVSSFVANAQISFSCTHREICYWNDQSKSYEECYKYKESSLFEFNKSETMFYHTIENMTSTYYVKSKEYDNLKNIWTYNVVSDVGNYYICFVQPDANLIKMLGMDGVLSMFYIKSAF